jgi:hypothetical protein
MKREESSEVVIGAGAHSRRPDRVQVRDWFEGDKIRDAFHKVAG